MILTFFYGENYLIGINKLGLVKVYSLHSMKYLQVRKNRDGYLRMRTTHRGRQYDESVASVVARYYLGERATGLQINHKDGVKTNNHPDNLEYVTPHANIRHAMELGLKATAKPKPEPRYRRTGKGRDKIKKRAYMLEWARRNKERVNKHRREVYKSRKQQVQGPSDV